MVYMLRFFALCLAELPHMRPLVLLFRISQCLCDCSTLTAVKIFCLVVQNKKSNLFYARGMTPKRVTSGGAHLRGLAHW